MKKTNRNVHKFTSKTKKSKKKKKKSKSKLVSRDTYNSMVSDLWTAKRVIAVCLHKLGGALEYQRDYPEKVLHEPWQIDLSYENENDLVTVTLIENA